jgi:hypothetical protein
LPWKNLSLTAPKTARFAAAWTECVPSASAAKDLKWEDAHLLGSFGIGGGKRIVVAGHGAES